MSSIQSFEIDGVKFGSGELSFLLGPCVVESLEHAREMLARAAAALRMQGSFVMHVANADRWRAIVGPADMIKG